ncbi:MAG: hypothetical protein J6T72_00010 [Alphaproteobacteria bacterium]|nr:hypothetical protein [Alphaproteobacteria bacterium]
MEKKKIYSAEYVRPEDSKFTAFCLFMLEIMAKPRFSLIGILWRTFAIFAGALGLAIWINSPAPLLIILCAAGLAAIPAAIGAFIRDKRMRQE